MSESSDLNRELARLAVQKIAELACTDKLACELTGIGSYNFWLARKKCPELAAEYQLVNDHRAQYYLERSEELFLAAQKEMHESDPKLASAIVTLARNHASHLRQYAAMTDKNRWGDTRASVSISVGQNSTDSDIAAAISVAQRARQEIENLEFKENKEK